MIVVVVGSGRQWRVSTPDGCARRRRWFSRGWTNEVGGWGCGIGMEADDHDSVCCFNGKKKREREVHVLGRNPKLLWFGFWFRLRRPTHGQVGTSRA